MFRVFQLKVQMYLSFNHAYIRSNDKYDVNWFWYGYSHFHKKSTLSYMTKKRILLKRVVFYWALKSAILKKGCFSSKIREKGVFFELGYEHGIRFGREWGGVSHQSCNSFLNACVLLNFLKLACDTKSEYVLIWKYGNYTFLSTAEQ